MQIMAVVNITPDSFFDGGVHDTTEMALHYALQCITAGADLLDIGGESSRPGASAISTPEEIARVVPVIRGIRQYSKIPISLDTTKLGVAQAAVAAGPIQYINDISALRVDPALAGFIAEQQLSVILMHMQGAPQTMQQAPQYQDVVAEVYDFFRERLAFAQAAGIALNKILLDPGIGFGKTLEHNLTLLKNLKRFANLGCPLVVGTSRKSFIGKLDNDAPSTERLAGSLATIPAMVKANVAIIRTHDPAATRQFLRVYQQI